MATKLVRDKIPEQYTLEGMRTASDEEFLRELIKKLQEEVDEFKEDQNVEELADILEVIQTLSKQLGTSVEELETLRKKKIEKSGGFDKRIISEGYKG